MKQLLELNVDQWPRAVFVANSVMAFGCYKAIFQASIQNPEEIALVSFGILNFVEALEPPITTLSNTGGVVGHEAAKLLFLP